MKKAQRAIAASIGMALLTLSACKKEEVPAAATATATPAATTTPPAPAPTAEQLAQATVENAKPLSADATTWTPEALEELAAPIALYPDPVLEQVLIASTNPQEVLDAGNWLLDNKNLNGKALDQAAEQMGFTPPMRALLPFPETVDMMAGQMGWTEELGQAYVNDQAGVMDAIQRLRQQAEDVGTLQSSPQMTVASETVDDVRYITVSPPSPEVIYVPQYDPVTVYSPQPEPTTTTVVQEGHSTGALITTGLLAFGAGMLVNEIFDNDDDCRNYYYNNCRGGGYYGGYWGVPRPYYPPYPYRPNYGNGFYPGYGYNRPGYGGGFNNNDININGDININSGNDYWNRFDKRPVNGDRPGYGDRRPEARSPISAANPNRKDLDRLNREAAQGPKRPAPSKGPEFSSREQFQKARPETRPAGKNSTVQGTYKGAKPATANVDRVAQGKAAAAAASRDLPKVQGNYAGNKAAGNAKPVSRDAIKKPDARPATAQPKPQGRPSGDRGYADNPSRQSQKPEARPQQRTEQKPQMKPQRPEYSQQRPEQRQQKNTYQRSEQRPQQNQQQKHRNAMSGSKQSGSQARAASQRGQQSRPQGSGGNRSGKRK